MCILSVTSILVMLKTQNLEHEREHSSTNTRTSTSVRTSTSTSTSTRTSARARSRAREYESTSTRARALEHSSTPEHEHDVVGQHLLDVFLTMWVCMPLDGSTCSQCLAVDVCQFLRPGSRRARVKDLGQGPHLLRGIRACFLRAPEKMRTQINTRGQNENKMPTCKL